MDLTSSSRVGGRMSLVLLVLGNIAMAIDQTLDCTNDYDGLMSCEFTAQDCSDLKVTFVRDFTQEMVNCMLKRCDSGRCCCSVEMRLVSGETHNATVWRGGESLGSKIISVTDSVKPRAPEITSVKEFHGNFFIMWKTNMVDSIKDELTAIITYYKKGDPKSKVTKHVNPSTNAGLQQYEIPSQHLEARTTYVVSVQSHTAWSDLSSDSSNEVDFTTPASYDVLLMAVLISLSIAAVIISAAMYCCYVKFKSKWWDPVSKCPNPKLLDMHPSKQEILKPAQPVISSVSVEPLISDDSKSWSKGSLRDSSSGSLQQTSGISTGSSCLSYANTEPPDVIARVQEALSKTFANISPISPLTTNPLTEMNRESSPASTSYNLCGVRADDVNSGSSGFDNKTYSIVLPASPHHIATDGSEVQAQARMFCESAYRPSDVTVICADQQTPACPPFILPPVVSSLMQNDMSYQQCNADSGRFSYAEDSSLSSISSAGTSASCDPASRAEAECESSDDVGGGASKPNGKTEKVTVIDENPCYNSHSFPPVDDNYQAFQNLVGQPVVVFAEKRGDEEKQHLAKYPEESFTTIPQSSFSPDVPTFIGNIQGGQSFSEHQRPLLSLTSAQQLVPIVTESGYQSV